MSKHDIEKKFYHYTVGQEAIDGILKTGVIHKEPQYKQDQVTAAWVSANPEWENTVKKNPASEHGGLALHAERYGAYRIRLNPEKLELHSWTDHKQNRGESARECSRMVKSGKVMGANPYDWYCSYAEIPVNEETVLSVGVYRNGCWEDMPMADFIRDRVSEQRQPEDIEAGRSAVPAVGARRNYVTTPEFSAAVRAIVKMGGSGCLSLYTSDGVIGLR